MSTQNTTFNTVKNLIKKGFISESDLADFANDKLAQHELSLTSKAAVQKRKKRPVKGSKAPVRARSSSLPTDGRTNKHAILFAINELGECKSKELKEKLEAIRHPMQTAVFHTQLSTLQSKDGAVKSKGKIRHNVYSLSADGKKMLAGLNGKEEPEASDVFDVFDEVTEE